MSNSAGSIRIALLSIAIMLASFFGTSALAWADIEVEVGYSGGPYYHKRTYTDAEIAAMSSGPYHYSALDHAGRLRSGWGYGVPINDLLAGANIEPRNFWGFYFATRDGYLAASDEGVQAAWTLDNLNSTRYCYERLPQNFDFALNQIYADNMADLIASGNKVPSILASSSSYRIMSALNGESWTYFDENPWNGGPSLWEDTSQMSRTNAYRLLFGQSTVNESNAMMNAHSIERIQCIYKGTPTIVLDQSTVTGAIGDTKRVEVKIIADDPLIAQEGLKDIKIVSDDPNIATVTRNSDGSFTITIVGDGEANIGLTFGNSSNDSYRAGATVGVNRGTGDKPGPGSNDHGEGTGNDDHGEGPGSGNEGTGTGSGGGTNDTESHGEGVELAGGSDLMLVAADSPAPSSNFDAATADVFALSADSFAEEGASGLYGNGMEALTLLTMNADEQVPLQAFQIDDNPQLIIVAGIGGLMLLGGIGRVGSFEYARDPYAPRRKIEKPKPLVKVGI